MPYAFLKELKRLGSVFMNDCVGEVETVPGEP